MTISSETVKAATDLLIDARRTGVPLEALPDSLIPATTADAYTIQEALAERAAEAFGGGAIGYKVGATTAAIQAQLGHDEPLYGRLMSFATFESPARLPAADYLYRLIEAEFAYEMARGLPARPEPYTAEEVAAAVGAVRPAIELAAARYRDRTTVGALSLIADNGVNGAWITGPAFPNWREFHIPSHRVALAANGETKGEGTGAAVLNDPVNSVTWLANKLRQRGRGLEAGDIISAGTCTGVYLAQKGDVIVADFGSMGQVTLEFE